MNTYSIVHRNLSSYFLKGNIVPDVIFPIKKHHDNWVPDVSFAFGNCILTKFQRAGPARGPPQGSYIYINITHLGNQGGLPCIYTFLGLFSVYKRFLRNQMGSRSYKNSYRELRSSFFRSEILVNTCWLFGQQMATTLGPAAGFRGFWRFENFPKNVIFCIYRFVASSRAF